MLLSQRGFILPIKALFFKHGPITVSSTLNIYFIGVPPLLSGFVCAFCTAAPGLSLKHTIYTFINLLKCEKDENKEKEAFYKTNYFIA